MSWIDEVLAKGFADETMSFRYVPFSAARPRDEYSFTSYDTDHDHARGHGDVVLGEVLAVRDEEVP